MPDSLSTLLNNSASSSFLTSTNYTTGQIIVSLLLSFLFALYIYIVYKKTYNGVVFSRQFGLTLIIVSLVASAIVMAISGNLALSLGMLGALSIVRFRSAIKDPRDIGFLFWAITSGIITGVFIFKLAFIANLMIGTIILFFSAKTLVQKSFLLVISGTHIAYARLEPLLQASCAKFHLRLQTSMESQDEIHVEVSFKKSGDTFSGLQELVEQIRSCVPGVSKVTTVTNEETLF